MLSAKAAPVSLATVTILSIFRAWLFGGNFIDYSSMQESAKIPVIDLFAGPGGLGEGFSAFAVDATPAFDILLSVEKEKDAHSTLLLRSFFRQFPRGKAPDEYYKYLRREISREHLFECHKDQFRAARERSQCIEIGPSTRRRVRELIRHRVCARRGWVLIGGPPCQVYSVIGRSRVLGADRRNNTNNYEGDHRHTLYREYLRIIADHWPPVFVMENVRGLLSSKRNGELLFPKLLRDLQDPGRALHRRKGGRHQYEVLSLVTHARGHSEIKPREYVIRTEEQGLPQSRHRLILLGIRNDLMPVQFDRLAQQAPTAIEEAIADMPPVRSGLSRTEDAVAAWRSAVSAVREAPWLDSLGRDGSTSRVAEEIRRAVALVSSSPVDRGAEFVRCNAEPIYEPEWFADPRLGGVCNHAARVHIESDLHRYLFAACYARAFGKSPVLRNFPTDLLPEHRNASEAVRKGTFDDRFRVQYNGRPSTTITSHLAKDGHHFIHYDPVQCRSLTVREAARLQTFPDNYFFEGSRSAQYVQVGNAVPPLLAHRIAGIVCDILRSKELT